MAIHYTQEQFICEIQNNSAVIENKQYYLYELIIINTELALIFSNIEKFDNTFIVNFLYHTNKTKIPLFSISDVIYTKDKELDYIKIIYLLYKSIKLKLFSDLARFYKLIIELTQIIGYKIPYFKNNLTYLSDGVYIIKDNMVRNIFFYFQNTYIKGIKYRVYATRMYPITGDNISVFNHKKNIILSILD